MVKLLKQLAPSIDRVAVLYDPNDPTNRGQLPEIASRAPALAVQSSTFSVRNAAEITDTIDAFANKPNGGLVVLPNRVAVVHRELIAALATKHRLPAVYPYRFHVASGGLASYGVDFAALYRGAASYVDRILKGEKSAELPVQFATKFELVINLKAAAALGLDIPVSLLARRRRGDRMKRRRVHHAARWRGSRMAARCARAAAGADAAHWRAHEHAR